MIVITKPALMGQGALYRLEETMRRHFSLELETCHEIAFCLTRWLQDGIIVLPFDDSQVNEALDCPRSYSAGGERYGGHNRNRHYHSRRQ